jgi:hypothetical protein
VILNFPLIKQFLQSMLTKIIIYIPNCDVRNRGKKGLGMSIYLVRIVVDIHYPILLASTNIPLNGFGNLCITAFHIISTSFLIDALINCINL